MIETIYAFVGFVLSLALSFFPGLKTWYEKLQPLYKSLIFAGMCLAGALGLAIYEATHGGDFAAVLLSLAKAFFSSWLTGTVTNIPVVKVIREREYQSICNCSQE